MPICSYFLPKKRCGYSIRQFEPAQQSLVLNKNYKNEKCQNLSSENFNFYVDNNCSILHRGIRVILFNDMSCVMRRLSLEFRTRPGINGAVQPKMMVRGILIWIKEVEGS